MPGRGYKKPKPELHCDYCDYVTTRPSYLEDHIRVHTGEKPFVCKVCGKAFSQKSNLGQHMKVHGAGDQTKYQCEFCQFSSKWKTSLQVHLRTHTGERPFKCKLCDRTFSQSTHCNSHMREAHEGIRSYKCPHCQKQFKRLEHLMKHKEYHSTKSYPCKHCNITFHSIWSLKKHRKKCTRCFLLCSLCNQQCIDRQALAFHYAQHCSIHQAHCSICVKYRTSQLTDVVDSAKRCNKMCGFCSKAFASPYLRLVHETFEHKENEKIKICDGCFFKTKSNNSLQRHYRLFHGRNRNLKRLHCIFCTRYFRSKTVRLVHVTRVHKSEYAKTCKERWARHMIYKLAGKDLASQILNGQYLPTSRKTETIMKLTTSSGRRGGRRDVKDVPTQPENRVKETILIEPVPQKQRRKQAAPQKISKVDVSDKMQLIKLNGGKSETSPPFRFIVGSNAITQSVFIPQTLSALGLQRIANNPGVIPVPTVNVKSEPETNESSLNVSLDSLEAEMVKTEDTGELIQVLPERIIGIGK